jgi:ABC-2 type transport system permease protein
MVGYYVYVAFFSQLDQSQGLVWEFAGDIRNGNFSKFLARPLDPLAYFLAVCLGRSTVKAGVLLIASPLWGIPFSGMIRLPSLTGMLFSLPLLFLGLVSLALINYLTALLAFKFQDVGPFHMIKNNLLDFLSGALIPLSVLPPVFAGILRFTPFPAINSLPALLWLGREETGLPRMYLVSLAWAVALYALSRLAYRRLVAAHEEVGA